MEHQGCEATAWTGHMQSHHLSAVIGCDTTYRPHGIGNGASLNKYQTNNAYREQAKVLHTHSASTHDVTCAGEREHW